jgi:multidrug efflux system membrane fusion protein
MRHENLVRSLRRAAIKAAPTVLLVITACAKKQAPPPPKAPVSVAKAERRAIPYQIAATGTVEPMHTAEVTAQVGGLLQAVHFNEGDEVRQGQVLFEIDPRPFQAALQQAEANLSRDVSQLANAAREAERARQLAAGGLGTAEESQSKQAAHDALASTVRADSAALTVARLNVEYATVRAPISGRTGSLLVKAGNLVRAAGTQPLVTINELRPIMVRFAVPAARLPELQRAGSSGLHVAARPGGREDAPPFEGVLSFLDNHVDSATGTVMLKARFANGDGALWPGEFVDVTLVLGMQSDATVVPSAAIMTGQQGPYIFTVEQDGSAKQRLVNVGRSFDSVTVISSGIEPGMTVVIDGQLRLTQGAKVDIKGPQGGTTSLGARGAAAPAPGGSGGQAPATTPAPGRRAP